MMAPPRTTSAALTFPPPLLLGLAEEPVMGLELGLAPSGAESSAFAAAEELGNEGRTALSPEATRCAAAPTTCCMALAAADINLGTDSFSAASTGAAALAVAEVAAAAPGGAAESGLGRLSLDVTELAAGGCTLAGAAGVAAVHEAAQLAVCVGLGDAGAAAPDWLAGEVAGLGQVLEGCMGDTAAVFGASGFPGRGKQMTLLGAVVS